MPLLHFSVCLDFVTCQMLNPFMNNEGALRHGEQRECPSQKLQEHVRPFPQPHLFKSLANADVSSHRSWHSPFLIQQQLILSKDVWFTLADGILPPLNPLAMKQVFVGAQHAWGHPQGFLSLGLQGSLSLHCSQFGFSGHFCKK